MSRVTGSPKRLISRGDALNRSRETASSAPPGLAFAAFITESPSGPRWITSRAEPGRPLSAARTKVHRRIYGTNRDEAISRRRRWRGGGATVAVAFGGYAKESRETRRSDPGRPRRSIGEDTCESLASISRQGRSRRIPPASSRIIGEIDREA